MFVSAASLSTVPFDPSISAGVSPSWAAVRKILTAYFLIVAVIAAILWYLEMTESGVEDGDNARMLWWYYTARVMHWVSRPFRRIGADADRRYLALVERNHLV